MSRPNRLPTFIMILNSFLMVMIGMGACKDAAASEGITDNGPPASTVAVFGDIYASSGPVQVRAGDWDLYLEDNPGYVYQIFPRRQEAEAFVREKMVEILTDKYFLEEAREMGLLDDPQILANIDLVTRTNLYQWFELELLPEMFKPSLDEIRDYYHENIEKFRLPLRVTFKQIFLKLDGLDEPAAGARRRLADDLLRQLRDDPGRFSEFALEHSDSSMEPRDGWVSNMEVEKFIPELREPLLGIEEGRFSDVTEGPAGLHIFWVEERSSGFQTFATAKNTIISELTPPRQHEYLDVMLETADEEFDLYLPPVPDHLEPDTLIVGGAEEIFAADVALALGRSIEEIAAGHGKYQVFHSTQGMSLALAMMRREGWDKRPKFRQISESARKKFLWQVYQNRRIGESGGITEAMLRDYYEEHAGDYLLKQRCLVRECRLFPGSLSGKGRESIPIQEVLQKAHGIREAFEEGTDFETLIRSEPMAVRREEGGILTWVNEYMDTPLVKYEEVSGLEIGEITQPKRLPQGVILVQLIEREENVQTPFGQHRVSIRAKIRFQLGEQYHDEFATAVKNDLQWSIPDEVIDRHLEN